MRSFGQARAQELLGLLRRPVGVERPAPHRAARQPHANVREERQRPKRSELPTQIRHDHLGRVRKPLVPL